MANHGFESFSPENFLQSRAGSIREEQEKNIYAPEGASSNVSRSARLTSRDDQIHSNHDSGKNPMGSRIYESWEAFTARTLRETAHVDDLEQELKRATSSASHIERNGSSSLLKDRKYYRPLASQQSDFPSRQRIQEELEAALRARDDAHERARLEHQRTVLRLQKDHAASEVTFRSIVTHLEEQLRLAREEVSRVAEEARSVSTQLQREIVLSREKHATEMKSAVANAKLATEQEALQLLREIEDQHRRKEDNFSAQNSTLSEKVQRYEHNLKDAQADVDSLQSVLQQREDDCNSIKQALDKTQRELHTTLRELEASRTEATEAAARAKLLMQDMQSTSETLHQDAAATIARLESERDQQAALKNAEIKELKQLVLETRQDAAAKVKASIEEYQTRAQAVSEKVDLVRAQVETAARDDLAALRDDYEARISEKDANLAQVQQELQDVKNTHLQDKNALTKAHREELAAAALAADKKALERQLASDEQHRLEIERLARGRDQAKRALDEHANAVAAEMATLQDMHQQDLRKQSREYEDMLGTLRAEVVQQACDLERLHHTLDTERTAHAEQVHDVTAAQQRERERLTRRLEQLSSDRQHDHDGTVAALRAEHHERLQTELHDLRTSMSKRIEEELAKQKALHERNLELENELHATNTAHRQAMQDAHNAQCEHLRRVEQDHHTQVTELHRDVDALRAAKRTAEESLAQLTAEYEDRLQQLQSTYEEQIRGLLPAEMQGQLENTIAALKQQAEALEMKATVLQSHVARSP
eukprot:m.1504163 g.1504163  ORF g.1504163 m.1504163 type:complete len:769 (-) comp25208_c0_seq34:228-2534(-)